MTATVTPPAAHPHAPRAALVLSSRLTPVLRDLLHRLGARVAPLHEPTLPGPALERLVLPAPETAPEWLDPATTEALLEALRQRCNRGGAPDWLYRLMASHRAGALLDRDGSLELAHGPSPQRLVTHLLDLPPPG